ncbi:HAD family phosphatase [bacterium AH-315-C07]|nr:HAD family phosphatase [bacterium AH-315-C07]
MSKIKNIIFDFGKVIIDIDFQLSIDAFRTLGVENVIQKELFHKMELGIISNSGFMLEVRSRTSNKLSDQEIMDAWNALLLDIPDDTIRFLKECKQSYRTFLLSNTNSIHIEKSNSYLQERHNIPYLKSLFEKGYYSFELNLAKPDPEIFETVLSENNLIPSETLFIDDVPEYRQSAAGLGINTLKYTDGDVLRAVTLEELKRLDNL